MSFKLFDQGYTAVQIKGMHKPTPDDLLMEKLRKWKESEHVLDIIRCIQATDDLIEEQKLTLWLKAQQRRR